MTNQKRHLKPWQKQSLEILALIAWVFVSFYLPQYILSIPIIIFFRDKLDSTILLYILDIVIYFCQAYLILFLPYKLFKKWKFNRTEIGIHGLPTLTDIGLVLAGILIYMFSSAILTKLFEYLPWFNIDEQQVTGFEGISEKYEYILVYILLCIVGPIIEEVVFRGWLYGKLRKIIPKKLSILISIIITSSIFAIFHGQWNVAVDVFVMSAVLCGLREITGTIYSGTLVHMLKNIIAFICVFCL